ncbi:Protein male abnormal 7 [Trichinella nativa]|uniref:Protein male abnormal 7 n=2 Tax=Trichinella nativa TaxID=6335 RepID=A0A0V1L5D5_9BILA|nr:Protein male abnormal 7 [Trichinella nativa]
MDMNLGIGLLCEKVVLILFLGLTFTLFISAYPNGAPCSTQHTMRPSKISHGLPQQSTPPYRFAVIDPDGNAINKYGDKIYTIRLSGTVHFRGFIIQARLATKHGSVIGHLRAGEFLENTDKWLAYGIQFQNCSSHRNNSITHINDRPKYIIEANWRTKRNEGPIQFVITVIKEKSEYWAFWQPKSGLLLPKFPRLNKSAPYTVQASNFTTENEKANSILEKLVEETESSEYGDRPKLDLSKDWCKQNPCKNGGKCLNTYNIDRFQCLCKPEWTGPVCDKKNYCQHHQCKYGICIIKEDGYVCDCDPDYSGQYCDVECLSSSCNNGGVCVADHLGKRCQCLPGFTGKFCEKKIDHCKPNPCANGALCRSEFNSYTCYCSPGYMGEKCHRPCQDIYGSCDHWGEQNKCEIMRPATTFFDVNCAVTCGQCKFVNSTVKTKDPLPPLLEPFQWILGKWEVQYGRDLAFPLNMVNAKYGYKEQLTVANQRVLMFGTPYLNFSTVTTSKTNPRDQHVSLGFVTLKPASNPIGVSISSTTNTGITMIEEGEMDGENMKLELKYLITLKESKATPVKAVRYFKWKKPYLEETVQINRKGGSFDYFTKYFTKIENYII